MGWTRVEDQVHTVLRHALYSGDCVEFLSSHQPKWFLLEDFFHKEAEVRSFEREVAKVTKVV